MEYLKPLIFVLFIFYISFIFSQLMVVDSMIALYKKEKHYGNPWYKAFWLVSWGNGRFVSYEYGSPEYHQKHKQGLTVDKIFWTKEDSEMFWNNKRTTDESFVSLLWNSAILIYWIGSPVVLFYLFMN